MLIARMTDVVVIAALAFVVGLIALITDALVVVLHNSLITSVADVETLLNLLVELSTRPTFDLTPRSTETSKELRVLKEGELAEHFGSGSHRVVC